VRQSLHPSVSTRGVTSAPGAAAILKEPASASRTASLIAAAVLEAVHDHARAASRAAPTTRARRRRSRKLRSVTGSAVPPWHAVRAGAIAGLASMGSRKSAILHAPGIRLAWDGRRLVSGGRDQLLLLWDVDTGAALAGHSGRSAMPRSRAMTGAWSRRAATIRPRCGTSHR